MVFINQTNGNNLKASSKVKTILKSVLDISLFHRDFTAGLTPLDLSVLKFDLRHHSCSITELMSQEHNESLNVEFIFFVAVEVGVIQLTVTTDRSVSGTSSFLLYCSDCFFLRVNHIFEVHELFF